MGELSALSDKARVTKTHGFISFLETRGTLLRWYTQNIDGLEEKALVPKDQENSKKANSKIVQLHGNLQSVKCTLCSNKLPLVKEHVEAYFKKGVPPPCPSCDSKAQLRSALGKRAISVGSLRPDVVLYNEYHDKGNLLKFINLGDEIAQVIKSDLSKKPTVLLVLGTSLKVAGIKAMVKSAAKTVIDSRGVVVLINDVSLGKEWEGVFTHWIQGKCDDSCDLLQKGLLSLNKKQVSPSKSPVELKSVPLTSVYKVTKKGGKAKKA